MYKFYKNLVLICILLMSTYLFAATENSKKIVSLEQYGAIPNNSTFDNISIINEAILDVFNHGGGIVIIPENKYYIKPTSTQSIVLKSNVSLVGKSLASTLIVSSTTGNYALCIGQIDNGAIKERLYNITLKNFTLDQNPAGNIKCDITSIYGASNRQHGIELRNQENCHIENINLIGGGMNQLKMVGLSYNSKYGSIKNCRIYFRRGTTTVSNFDNTAIFFYGYNYEISGNIITTTDPSQGISGIEVHGSYGLCINNTVENFYNGIHIVGDHINYGVNCIVNNNQLLNVIKGIILWDSLTGSKLAALRPAKGTDPSKK